MGMPNQPKAKHQADASGEPATSMQIEWNSSALMTLLTNYTVHGYVHRE